MLEVSVPGRYPRKIYQVETDQEARPKPKRKVSRTQDCIWLNPYYVRTVVSTVHGVACKLSMKEFYKTGLT